MSIWSIDLRFMKKLEKDEATRLRKQGKSMNDISRELGVSKSSVSYWVRDIKLTSQQRKSLTSKGFSVEAVEKRRRNRIVNTNRAHQIIVDKAKGEIAGLSHYELLLVGAALYWGEGSKANRNVASIANSDPAVIKLMMRFFKEICNVKQDKFRGHIHTFSHLNSEESEEYWSAVSDIPRNQFYKTYVKPSRASLGKKDSLPHGTMQIYVCDTNVALSIRGWRDRLRELGGSENLG